MLKYFSLNSNETRQTVRQIKRASHSKLTIIVNVKSSALFLFPTSQFLHAVFCVCACHTA